MLCHIFEGFAAAIMVSGEMFGEGKCNISTSLLSHIYTRFKVDFNSNFLSCMQSTWYNLRDFLSIVDNGGGEGYLM